MDMIGGFGDSLRDPDERAHPIVNIDLFPRKGYFSS